MFYFPSDVKLITNKCNYYHNRSFVNPFFFQMITDIDDKIDEQFHVSTVKKKWMDTDALNRQKREHASFLTNSYKFQEKQ